MCVKYNVLCLEGAPNCIGAFSLSERMVWRWLENGKECETMQPEGVHEIMESTAVIVD